MFKIKRRFYIYYNYSEISNTYYMFEITFKGINKFKNAKVSPFNSDNISIRYIICG